MSTIVNDIKEKVMGASTPSGQHLAAIMTAVGAPLEIVHRPTPSPGPNDILVEVKSIAINPVDFFMRAAGFAISGFPAVLGSDVGGIVISAGSSVPSDAPKPGTRIAAFATAFYKQGAPDYGAFQTRVLVPASNVVPIPHEMSFNEATLLPMGVATTWGGLYRLGVPRDAAYTAADKKGLLVWGGASAIGSAAIQVAKLMGFSVYVTASEKHHEYLKGLGASKTFDYKSEGVVGSIVKAAKEDGVALTLAFDAVGQLQPCLEVLKEFKGDGTPKVAEATPMSADAPKMEGVEAEFMQPPEDEEERTEFSHFVFNVWLKEKLAKGEYVPSPKIRLVQGGLESINKALDEWKAGVSGEKIVLEI